LLPIPRVGVPADIAQAALWLASDDSSFVNGTNLSSTAVSHLVGNGPKALPGAKNVMAALGISDNK
jgi:Enoyl-(Acyl carrier protein) reductase